VNRIELRPIRFVPVESITAHSPIQKSNWRCSGFLQSAGVCARTIELTETRSAHATLAAFFIDW